MKMVRLNIGILISTFCGLATLALAVVPPAKASCGSTTCFLVIGSQAGVSQKGVLTANMIYNYIPQGTLLDGTTGIIPAIEVDDRKMVLNEHREIRTINQFYTLDLNYGVTERFAVQVTVPTIVRSHRHLIEQGATDEEEQLFTDNGLGDIRLTGKYNILPTLRNLVVLGVGIELPTGKFNTQTNVPKNTQEPTLQLSRGNVGLVGTLYQAYELVPHRLNQFSSVSYRHTFRNNNGYQFGDEYILSGGLNYQALNWLVLTGQFNWRYLVHDNFSSSLRQHVPAGPSFDIDTAIRDRRVPTTGSTTLMWTPGFTLNVLPQTALYVNVQIPVARDFNNNLAQGVSYVFGITRSFQLF
ncbi:MAG: hypothetical protein ACE1ZA_14600 [Pseudomonadales bacterium]